MHNPTETADVLCESAKTGGAEREPPFRPSSWKAAVAKYQRPMLRRSVWQLVNSLVPYFGLWALMIWSTGVSYWITLALAVPAAGFLTRIFIISHDCGHGSFFRSRRANDFWGGVTGVLCFTPYRQWRHNHALHHATSGDLDGRGKGDVWTMTVREYVESSRGRRLAYRLMRNPLVLFLVVPMYLFWIQYRIPSRDARIRERRSVHGTNVALVAIVVLMSLLLGVKTYFTIQLFVSLLATTGGIWLFYVQHQFEGVYWERRTDWDFVQASLAGASYYRLPRILQWFSGNIGFHHVHHLSPAIPNYNLEKCHLEDPVFRTAKVVTLGGSLKSLSFRLWDEQARQLIGFRSARRRAARRAP